MQRGLRNVFTKTMWCMVRDAFNGHYSMSFLSYLLLVGGVLYVVFPFDLISDLIPVVGWIDDGAVIYFIVKRLQKEMQRYNRFKVMERKRY